MSLALRAIYTPSSRFAVAVRAAVVGAGLLGAVVASPAWATEGAATPQAPAAASVKKDAEVKKAPADAKSAEANKKAADVKAATPKEEPKKPLPADISGECAWVGKRVISLLSRDDVDQARRFMDFYRSFGCKEAHVAPAFRCVVKEVEGGKEEALGDRVDRCWTSPE